MNQTLIVPPKCNQEECIEKAEFKVYWPGRETLGMCEFHKKKAENISNVLGFVLVVEPMS